MAKRKKTTKNSDNKPETQVSGRSAKRGKTAASGGAGKTACKGSKRTQRVVKSGPKKADGGRSVKSAGSSKSQSSSGGDRGVVVAEQVADISSAGAGDHLRGGTKKAAGKSSRSGKAAAAKPASKSGSKTKASKRKGKSGSSAAPAKASTRGKSKKSVKKKVSKKKLPVAVAVIRDLAFHSDSFTDAASKFVELAAKRRCKRDLQAILDEHQDLQDAWQRGRLLKNIGELAATGVNIGEAEHHLKLATGELKAMMAEQSEVADIWNQSRLKLTIDLKQAVVANALQGKVGALKQVETLLRREIARPSADFHSLSIADMCEILGITRQTLHDWYKERGCPRNSDGSYDLCQFFEWYERHIIETRGTAGKSAAPKLDPLKAAKAQKMEKELAELEGRLLDRQQVVMGLMARHQKFVNESGRGLHDLAMRCHKRDSEDILKLLNEHMTDLRQKMCEVPAEMRLPSDAENKLIEVMSMLAPAEGDGGKGQV
ncbi:hypothetical protein STSP2_03144 [Anaerohalosphaera lusitana]|uniref:Uncharacterized protein n=1 Tax=Anaerohalosphaera lusitana TaxID=1936003 RepID=A0A1U9NQD1_9BACT|nr:hypothetical protein [Anaerohalosphaera lusitana]AQT69944.1 hypothetical protein STSP2_03144 [Anaerohalosphaera lusitana]